MKRSRLVQILIIIISVLIFGLLTYVITNGGLKPVNPKPTKKNKSKNLGIYSAIEVGSSGAKYAVVELSYDSFGNPRYKIKNEGNTNYGDNYIQGGIFNIEKGNELKSQINNHIAKVIAYYDTSNLEINWDNFYVAFSNDYFNVEDAKKFFREFFADEYKNINLKENLDFLDVKLEGKSDFLTSTTSTEFPLNSNNCLNIDIGTNSTKFTIHERGNISAFSKLLKNNSGVSIGKSYIYDLVKPLGKVNVSGSGNDRLKVEKIIENSSSDIHNFLKTYPNFERKPNIILTGGIPYGVFKMTYQDEIIENGNNFIDVHIDQIYDNLVEAIKNEKTPFSFTDRKGKTEFENREKTFYKLVFLNTLYKELNKNEKKSYFFFQRKSWLPGYIIHKNE